VAFVGYFSLVCINIQEVVLQFQYINKKLLIICEYYWHFNLNMFSHPTFPLITNFNQIKKIRQLSWPLRNICVTNDYEYAPFVKITIWSFFHSWLVTGFVTRVTRQMPHVEQELLTLTEHPGLKWGSCCSIFIILCNGL
jgi:hypothetical protein